MKTFKKLGKFLMKIKLSIAVLLAANASLIAGGDIIPVLEAPNGVEESSFIKEANGYIRAGYQNSDISGDTDYTNTALGGKLHIETRSLSGISAGASIYTTNVVFGNNEGEGIPFFDANNDSYTILGEAYLMGKWGNSILKIGRQEIDTPFLDTDDIGMVPNTYEAALFLNKDIANTTIILAHVERMAGVDAQNDPAKFEDIRDNDYVQIAGIEYEATENLALSGWYYNLKNPITDNLIYADATYSDQIGTMSYEMGAQYAHRNLSNIGHEHAHIFGAMADVSFENSGINIGVAYNTAQDNYATNGFGGGPFYTSAEHLTLREATIDGEALRFWGGWDASAVVDGLGFGAGYLTLEDQYSNKANELDLTASYAMNDALGIDLIYSDIDDDINGDRYTNLRVFINYIF